MRIYYKIDVITDNCQCDCPFKNTGIKGETGPDYMLGSFACQQCKYCYGHYDKGFVGFYDNFNNIKFNENCYIKCMFPYRNKTKYKILRFFYKIKNLFNYIN